MGERAASSDHATTFVEGKGEHRENAPRSELSKSSRHSAGERERRIYEPGEPCSTLGFGDMTCVTAPLGTELKGKIGGKGPKI
jgi:hypothetical protein